LQIHVQRRTRRPPPLAMNSLPQELIDAVIDNLPRSSLFSSSLVLKRWRRRSQRRVLERIKFISEDQVDRWYTDFPQDPKGIASYVRFVGFQNTIFPGNLATFGCALQNLCSLTTLWVNGMEIPDELPAQIPRMEVWKRIIILRLWSISSTLTTVVSVVLSLPNLEVLSISRATAGLGWPLSSHPVIPPHRAPLDLLELRGDDGGIGRALTRSGLMSRHLSLDVDHPDMDQLIMPSSETLVKLTLYGM